MPVRLTIYLLALSFSIVGAITFARLVLKASSIRKEILSRDIKDERLTIATDRLCIQLTFGYLLAGFIFVTAVVLAVRPDNRPMWLLTVLGLTWALMWGLIVLAGLRIERYSNEVLRTLEEKHAIAEALPQEDNNMVGDTQETPEFPVVVVMPNEVPLPPKPQWNSKIIILAVVNGLLMLADFVTQFSESPLKDLIPPELKSAYLIAVFAALWFLRKYKTDRPVQ